MLTYNRKGRRNVSRAMFVFDNGLVKSFSTNTKKEKRRVKRFTKKYHNFETWFDSCLRKF